MSTETQEQIIAPTTRFISSSFTNEGVFSTTGKSIKAGLNTTVSVFESIDTGASIVLTSLKLVLAEEIAEGIVKLVALGYSEKEAQKILC